MHTYVTRLARSFAILGGLVLSALIVLTCLSIVGRSINSMLHGDLLQSFLPGLANALLATGVGPINGDFELVEAGMAFTIFAFLPLCQLNGAHASVDIFTAKLPIGINRFLRMTVEIIFAAVLILIAVKLFAGMQSKHNSGQTTLLLQFPVWWGYAISVPGAIAAAFVAVHIALSRFIEVMTGREILPPEVESDH
ncbi:MAG: TRAP transporter small permease [Granulosicoccus sp.]